MTDNTPEMSMLFAFPDGSESFVLGFEAGLLWAEMENRGTLVIDRGVKEGFPIHTENMELVQRMASARSYVLESGVAKDGWVPVLLTWKADGKTSAKLEIVR